MFKEYSPMQYLAIDIANQMALTNSYYEYMLTILNKQIIGYIHVKAMQRM